MFRRSNNKKFESMEDPREVLLSLVDLGSADIEDVLLACVNTMSDREVKNVLGQFTLATVEDEFDSEDEVDEIDDVVADAEDDFVDDSDSDEEEDSEDSDEESDDEVEENCNKRSRLEDRIRRLERKLIRM